MTIIAVALAIPVLAIGIGTVLRSGSSAGSPAAIGCLATPYASDVTAPFGVAHLPEGATASVVGDLWTANLTESSGVLLVAGERPNGSVDDVVAELETQTGVSGVTICPGSEQPIVVGPWQPNGGATVAIGVVLDDKGNVWLVTATAVTADANPFQTLERVLAD